MGPRRSRTNPGTKQNPKALQDTRPDWPPLKPLVPTAHLELSSLVDKQIILIKNFWTSTLCKNYVEFLKSLPLITTPGQPKKGEALRVNDRFQITDEGFANKLWLETGLRELLRPSGRADEDGMDESEMRELWGGDVVGLNPSIRVYRYIKGQYFSCHYDESNMVTLNTTSKPTPAKTTWTLLLYLTSPATGCQGGQTVFYPDELPGGKGMLEKEVIVELETGMLLLHKHGNACMLHEGKEVTAGEKWVIRSDLCVRK